MSDWDPLNNTDDIVSTISDLMNRNREEAKPEVVRIVVSPSATEGYMLQSSITGKEGEEYKARGVRLPREILIHTNDWNVIKKALEIRDEERRGPRAITDSMGSIGALVGIPVVMED